MVKIPKAPKGRILFRDDSGRFVSQAERYQKATIVQKLFRGKFETIISHRKTTPKMLADLLTRDEFEQLAANFSAPNEVDISAKKYRAWDAANKIEKMHGLRGKTVKITMNILDGDRLRKIDFYRRINRKGPFAYGMFKQMNEVLGNAKMNLYSTIGSKLMPDRKGKTVHLQSVEVSKEM